MAAIGQWSKMQDTRIGVRIGQSDRELLEKVCDARGEDISDFVRRAIRRELAGLNYYSNETKKALGIALPGTRGGR